MALDAEHCSACRIDAPRATPDEIREWLGEIPAWQLVSDDPDGILKLKRTYTFGNFRKAMEFTNRVGELAESEDHHPALTTEWGKVTVVWWTHKIRGLHRNDFICAAHTDRLATSN